MSLSTAILDIAAEMEQTARQFPPLEQAHAQLVLYAKQLRLVVSASEGAKPGVNDYVLQQPPPRPPVRKHELAEEKYANATGETMTSLEGGASEGTTVSIAADAPVGAFVIIDRQYYVKRADNVWRFDEERTNRSLMNRNAA